MTKGLQEIFLTQSLHLSTIFVGSITQIVLLGILIKEVLTLTNARFKRLYVYLAIALTLIEITLIAGFLASILDNLFYLHIPEFIISLAAFLLGIKIIINFHDLLNKKLAFLVVLFGIISICGVIVTIFFDRILGDTLDFIGSTGVTISLYFLIICSIISGRKRICEK